MQEEIENLELVQGVNFEIVDSLKINGTNYLLIFDDIYEEICKPKAFDDIATNGRHCGLGTIYFKHSLFHQCKLGRDVELKNALIVFFLSPRGSPRDLMQVSKLSAQLGLWSELVNWYRDATSIPYSHLLIALSPRTDDRLRNCTHTESIPSKFYVPDRLKQSNFLDAEHAKSLCSPSVTIIFTQKHKTFSSVLPKWVYQDPVWLLSKFSQRKLEMHNKTSRDKISKQSPIAHSEKNHLEAKNSRSDIRNWLQFKKVITRPVINHLSWHGAVCSRFCLYILQEFEYPVGYKGFSKVWIFTKS